jgi:hypothetical protein
MLSMERIKALMPISKHRLDDELEQQPQRMQEISEQLVVCNSAMLRAKETLSQVEARLALDYRDSEDKLTAAQVTAKITRARERVKAWEEYQDARSAHEEWTGLLEAWRARGFAIKTLADLYQAQYYSVDRTTHRQADGRTTPSRRRVD